MSAPQSELDMIQAALARPNLSPGVRGFLLDVQRKAVHWALTPRQREAVERIAHAPDFPALARAALPHLPELCRRWLPGGKEIRREWVCGSLAGEAGASCKINLRTGEWADFATGAKGGDAVSLAAAVHRLTQAEAAERLAQMLGMGGANHGR
jgi:hypothetical protein